MYGEGRNWRYIVGFGVAIVLLFFVIFLIVRGGNGDNAEVKETKREFVSYATESNVRVSLRTIGPITAAQTHDRTDINVSNSAATVELVKGYDGNVIASRSYPMSTESFREFLSALDKAGFTRGNTDAALKDDRGYCSTGKRYIVEMYQGANSLQRFWTTSCNGVKTYQGNAALTVTLFRAQIPDYGQITSDAANDSDFFGL